MGTVLLVLVVVLVVAALIFGVVSLLTGEDPGLATAEPDGRAAPLPNNRSLTEDDIKTVRFDVTWRGYRMTQVDRILRRTAYDIGYKNEMIAVLEAEVVALREGRAEDADLLRKAREAAANTNPTPASTYSAPLLADGWADDEDEEGDDVAGDESRDLVVTADLDPDAGGAADIAAGPDDADADEVPDPTTPGRLAYRTTEPFVRPSNGQSGLAEEADRPDEAVEDGEDEAVGAERESTDSPSARA